MTARHRLLALLILAVLGITTMGQDDSCAGEDVNQPLNEQGDTEDSADDEEGEEEEPAADFETIERDGNGAQNLAPIEVPGDATLSWTNDEDPAFRLFVLTDEAFEVNVTSEAESGETFVPAGTYRFDIAGGDWEFSIEPGAE